MKFECPLCGRIIERDLILPCEKEYFNKKNRSYKSYCDIYKQDVTCREYEEK